MNGKSPAIVILIALFATGLAGCNSGGESASVTPAQEQAFRSPPKEIPPEALKAMQKSREEGMRKAQQAQQAATPGR